MTEHVDQLLSNPAFVIILTVIIRYAWAWQAGLSYPEYRFAHALKCRLFLLLDPFARKFGRPLVHTKAYSTDATEFVAHKHENARAVAKRIAVDFDGHLIATAKRRETPQGKQWAHSQWVQRHGDDSQTEVFLFPTSGGTDVYAHVEGWAGNPREHIYGEQVPGDARGAFASAYDGTDE